MNYFLLCRKINKLTPKLFLLHKPYLYPEPAAFIHKIKQSISLFFLIFLPPFDKREEESNKMNQYLYA